MTSHGPMSSRSNPGTCGQGVIVTLTFSQLSKSSQSQSYKEFQPIHPVPSNLCVPTDPANGSGRGDEVDDLIDLECRQAADERKGIPE